MTYYFSLSDTEIEEMESQSLELQGWVRTTSEYRGLINKATATKTCTVSSKTSTRFWGKGKLP